MNLVIKHFLIILCLLLALSTLSFSQNKNQVKASTDEIKNAAREIIKSVGTCALITIDSEGGPRARTMETLVPESDFVIWFGTNPKSRKVAQIRSNPKVTLYYLDSDGSGYVMLYGNAELINDEVAKEAHWREEWEVFYPNKNEDYILIKVTPEWMEVISNSRGIFGDSDTWEVPKILFDFNN